MGAAVENRPHPRGSELLLFHCLAVGDLDDARVSARDRLDAALGGELTRLLLFALAGSRGRRGSSSP